MSPADVAESDPLLWQLRDFAVDADGQPAHMFWDVADVTSSLLPPAVTLDPSDPKFDHSVKRDFDLGVQPEPDRIELKIHFQPVGLDVIDDLIASGDLDPSYRDQFENLEVAGATRTWTPEAAGSDLCIQ
jgi:hypothetical protein